MPKPDPTAACMDTMSPSTVPARNLGLGLSGAASARFLRAFNLLSNRLRTAAALLLAMLLFGALWAFDLSPRAIAEGTGAMLGDLFSRPMYWERPALPLDQFWTTGGVIAWLALFVAVGEACLKRNRWLGLILGNALIWPLRLLPLWIAAFSAALLLSGWLWKRVSGTYAPPRWLRLLTGWRR